MTPLRGGAPQEGAQPDLPKQVVVIGPEDVARRVLAALGEDYPSIAAVWYPDLADLDQDLDREATILHLGDCLAQEARWGRVSLAGDTLVDPPGDWTSVLRDDILIKTTETPPSGRQNPPKPPKGGEIPARTAARRKRKAEQAARDVLRRRGT